VLYIASVGSITKAASINCLKKLQGITPVQPAGMQAPELDAHEEAGTSLQLQVQPQIWMI
jgi:hypothetical protein